MKSEELANGGMEAVGGMESGVGSVEQNGGNGHRAVSNGDSAAAARRTPLAMPVDLAARYKVIRRNGGVVCFDADKIFVAMLKAFLEVEGPGAAESAHVRDIVGKSTQVVVAALLRRHPLSGTFHIEDIQDQVELALMRGGQHKAARAYILYREQRAAVRRRDAKEFLSEEICVVDRAGNRRPLDVMGLRERVIAACAGLDDAVDPDAVLRGGLREIYDGASDADVRHALILAARALIEVDPDYSFVSARLLLDKLRYEVFGFETPHARMASLYSDHLRRMIEEGVGAGLINPELARRFDLRRLGGAIAAENDLRFGYLGLQTLYDRYFQRIGERRIELPQSFFMRVAMGLALEEKSPNERAVEFYEALSSFRFMSSTPTLFNSGTCYPQLSSCYLTTVGDDLDGIFSAIKENALLAKFAGGLGNDWTSVRAMGSHIKGTNGKSQGVVPFLKVANDTAVAVNQGGKRKGAVCAYLETWHLDIEEFLDLRKNTGDERRRTPDMNTANWIPDLFMKRVAGDGEWTLFSPSDAPDLHDLYGAAFARAYEEYEARAARGEIKHKKIAARTLWRRMLTMLYETGHPWIAFKDACNVRSPQRHAGVVHSSNLCTEITLNTGGDEIAVCNLGSVNLPAHLRAGRLDEEALAATVKTAMRMLDNVIDINYYAVDKAKRSNLRHRPVGLGMMGFQDCLFEAGIAYDSDEAVAFADESAEALAFFAYTASSDLARERGAYPSFKGSLWDQGVLPPDTLDLLRDERGGDVEADRSARKDWDGLREKIRRDGMRNSNCLAIAPTATIANIVGVTSSIEPVYRNVYVKSNLSGDFTVANRHLVGALKARGLWDEMMIADLKYYDGRLSAIDRAPVDVRRRYPTAFEIDPKWLVEAAARRQKWIDQAQSLNLYVAEPSGRKLEEIYTLAWRRGLKTTYYLRALGASATEKYTTRTGALNKVPVSGGVCPLDDSDCEACQ